MSGPRQTAQEAARDPYSLTFGQFQYSTEVDEPGLVPGTPKYAFRKHPSFGVARVALMKAYDASKATAGKLDLSGRGIDYHAGSIRMMGSAFMQFLSTVKTIEDDLIDGLIAAGKVPTEDEWKAIQKELYEPELNSILGWVMGNTGEDNESARMLLAAMYDAAGTASEGAASADAAATFVRHAKMNQVAREEQRMLDQIERRRIRQETEAYWRRWRQSRREGAAGVGTSSGTPEAGQMDALAAAAGLNSMGVAPAAPQPAPFGAGSAAAPTAVGGSYLDKLSPEALAILNSMALDNPLRPRARTRRL